MVLANTPIQAEYLLHSLEQAAGCIGLHMNADKTEYMCFNQEGAISTLNGSSLKLVDKFIQLGTCVLSTESDINMCQAKSYPADNRLLTIWKSNLSDKIKFHFFQAVVVSLILYGCATWMLAKRIEKRVDGSCIGMLQAVLKRELGKSVPAAWLNDYLNYFWLQFCLCNWFLTKVKYTMA